MSTRCSIIAACLVAILITLAILIALDVLKLISTKEKYDITAGLGQTKPKSLIAGVDLDNGPSTSSSSGGGNIRSASPLDWNESTPPNDRSRHEPDDDDDDDGGFRRRSQQQPDQNRLKMSERRRERPLLAGGRISPLAEPEPDLDLDFYNSGACSPPVVLTKANYISQPAGSRPKSPMFVRQATSSHSRSSSPARAANSSSSSPAPPRGVLKKTSSLTRSIDRESLAGRSGYGDEDVGAALAEQAELESYQHQVQESLQNQRPPFNVRFAE